jgi:hypothetical protein
VVAFRITETFGHERTVAVLGAPPGGQLAQGEAKALRGEIGPAGFLRHKEAAQLHDELETLRAGDRIPADDGVAVLKMPGGGAPDEHGDDFVFFEDELAEPVSRLASGTQQVLFIKHAVGDLPVGRGFGGADAQRGGARHRMTRGIWTHFHGEANRAFLRPFV